MHVSVNNFTLIFSFESLAERISRNHISVAFVGTLKENKMDTANQVMSDFETDGLYKDSK